MFPFRTVELAFQRFQTRREPRALAFVFDRTAPDLLALARHLSPPGSEPEDLVQATFVTAIEAAASHRAGERVLPWLCGILGNHARATRRQARRPVDPARLPHAIGDAAIDAEASELRAELAAAIDRLPEVYRPVLRLVFTHGLQAHEVAQALERPAGTVRAQVTRGLELLRRALPASLASGVAVAVAQGRGLAAVRQSVLGTVGGAGVGAVSPLFVGGLIVLHHKLFTAAAAVLVASLSLFWFLQEPPPPVVAASGADAAPAAASAPIEAKPAPNEPAADRNRVAEATPPAPAPLPASTEPSPAAATGTLIVHVRDQRDAPLPGVRVAIYPYSQLQDFGRRMHYVASDRNGDVRFEGLTGESLILDVDRVGTSGAVSAQPGERVEREVRLPAGVRVEGRVVDRRGAPVAGAEIVLHASRAEAIVLATSDAQGAFAVDHLASGLELQARAARRAPSLAHRVDGARGGSTRMELTIGDSARTVRGVVRDPDGRGVADAVVAILPARVAQPAPEDPTKPHVRAHWLHTADDGSFVCEHVEAEPLLVFVRALPLAPTWVECDATNGDAVADVLLRVGATLTGDVRRGDRPVAGVDVILWAQDEVPIGYLQNLFGIRNATTAADGTFRIDGIVPGQQLLRMMRQLSTLRQETFTLSDGETRTCIADLDDVATLRFRVRAPAKLDGLSLVVMVQPQPLRDGEPPAIAPIGKADGIGKLDGPRPGNVDVILCSMPGGMTCLQLAAVRGVPPQQDQVVFDLRPEQLPSHTITGRLVDARRAPVAGHTITAWRVSADGLTVRTDATTGDDGMFALGPLPTGDYQLLAGPMRTPVAIGQATLTIDRDEPVGDLVLPGR